MLDRFFDNYVMTPMQKMVFNQIRAEADRDPTASRKRKAMLDDCLCLARRRDGRVANGRPATPSPSPIAPPRPSLFYADWVHPIPEAFANVRAYRARLLARPSFARAVDEARPYRSYFPLGAPDRD